jgi:predicted membrane protein
MKDNPTKKDIAKFKIALFLFPIIPSIILYYKHHYTLSIMIIVFCWAIFLTMITLSIFSKNSDKRIYKTIHIILKYLGIIISSIALFITWVFAIFPTAVCAKIQKRDRLGLTRRNTTSYWKKAKEDEKTYENQY